MDEPRQHDGASLTDHVRQFRRMARLAAADPLRLLPIDALARLASLSAPAAELIDLAPLERLRHAVTAPPAASRRETPRTRVQSFASAGSHVLKTAAAAAITPAPQPVGRNAAPAGALRQRSSPPASLPLAGEPLLRNTAPATSLADRRAALRRRTSDAASSPAAAVPLVTQEAAVAGQRSISGIEAPEIGLAARGRKVLSEEVDDQPRRLTSVPFDPITLDSGSVAPGSSDRLASAALDRATAQARFGDDAQTAPAAIDRSSVSTSPMAGDLPAERDLAAASLRNGPSETGSAALPRARSSPVARPWPETARTSQAGLGARRRALEPEGDSDLVDSLFETLYREGVDLPWP